jgi:hypothetical protein
VQSETIPLDLRGIDPGQSVVRRGGWHPSGARPPEKQAGACRLGRAPLQDFEGEWSSPKSRALLVGPASHANATAFRGRLRWLRPQVLGLVGSFGCVDRLGLATPGHVRGLRAPSKLCGQRMLNALSEDADAYAEILERHFASHLAPLERRR